MIDVHYASLTSQGVQHRVFYLDGHISRYQPCPTGINFGEQTGTGVFPFCVSRTTIIHFSVLHSAQVMLTAEHLVDQAGNIVMSSLVQGPLTVPGTCAHS